MFGLTVALTENRRWSPSRQATSVMSRAMVGGSGGSGGAAPATPTPMVAANKIPTISSLEECLMLPPETRHPIRV